MKKIVILGILLTGCGQEATQEQKWVHDMDRKCMASRSRGSYNSDTKVYECWNRPFFRRPKLTFTEKYI